MNTHQRYHERYNNSQYQLIAHHISIDLNKDRESHAVVDIMNLIIDTCFEVCGDPAYKGCHRSLADHCDQLHHTTIAEIANYLRAFWWHDLPDTEDVAAIFEAVALSKIAERMLAKALAASSIIHFWHGRMAYELLKASDLFTIAAQSLLDGAFVGYTAEKLEKGLHSVKQALLEGSHEAIGDRFLLLEVININRPVNNLKTALLLMKQGKILCLRGDGTRAISHFETTYQDVTIHLLNNGVATFALDELPSMYVVARAIDDGSRIDRYDEATLDE